MNQSKHLDSIKNIIDTVATNVGTIDFTTIEANQSDMKTDLANISAKANTIDGNLSDLDLCVDIDNERLQINIQSLSGNTIDIGSGAADVGTQRIIIANDDPLIGDIDISTSRIAQTVDLANNRLKVDTNSINTVTMAVNSGTLNNGTQRVAIATDDVNMAATASGVQSLVMAGVNVSKLASNNIDLNSGNKSTGTQRIVIATDDINISSINTKLSVLSGNQLNTVTNAHALVVGTRDSGTNGQCSLGCGLARQDFASTQGNNVFISTGPGNVSAAPTYSADAPDAYGSIRVCVATDDVNLANINAILTDVWDSTNHYLKVHLIP